MAYALQMFKTECINVRLTMTMERVPTWSNSPYLGMFQYKDAGPNHIHTKVSLPFFLPPSPYLGALRHDRPLSAEISTKSVGTQTEVCLTAYVMNNYS